MSQKLESRRGSRTRWHILHPQVVLRECDWSFFKYDGMAIPLGMRSFFQVEDMLPGERRDCLVSYEGVRYPANFILSRQSHREEARLRLFWSRELGNLLRLFQDADPIPSVLVIRRERNIFVFELLLGSAADFALAAQWLLPWDPDQGTTAACFARRAPLSWPQEGELADARVNDRVFVYESAPVRAITHLCVVRRTGAGFSGEPGEAPLLELQHQRSLAGMEELGLMALMAHGLPRPPVVPVRSGRELSRYLTAVLAASFREDSPEGGEDLGFLALAGSGISTEQDAAVAATLSDEALVHLLGHRPSPGSRGSSPDPYLWEAVRRRAENRCQLCGGPAPFLDLAGRPYLEAHHIEAHPETGRDTLENLVALCPNCHRRVHVRREPQDIRRLVEAARDR